MIVVDSKTKTIDQQPDQKEQQQQQQQQQPMPWQTLVNLDDVPLQASPLGQACHRVSCDTVCFSIILIFINHSFCLLFLGKSSIIIY